MKKVIVADSNITRSCDVVEDKIYICIRIKEVTITDITSEITTFAYLLIKNSGSSTSYKWLDLASPTKYPFTSIGRYTTIQAAIEACIYDGSYSKIYEFDTIGEAVEYLTEVRI